MVAASSVVGSAAAVLAADVVGQVDDVVVRVVVVVGHVEDAVVLVADVACAVVPSVGVVARFVVDVVGQVDDDVVRVVVVVGPVEYDVVLAVDVACAAVDCVGAVVPSDGAVACFVVDVVDVDIAVGVVVVFSEIQFLVGDWLVVLPR